MVDPFVNHIDEEFRAIHQRFRKAASGTSASSPRAEVCVDTVTEHFPHAVGSLYVKNFFQPQAKKDVSPSFPNLSHAFEQWRLACSWL